MNETLLLISTITRSSSKVKFAGQSSQVAEGNAQHNWNSRPWPQRETVIQQDENLQSANVAKVVGATSSEGFLGYIVTRIKMRSQLDEYASVT